MKGFRSALLAAAAATGAYAITSAPVNPSEQFGILTIHSGAIAVHLQTWTLEVSEVFLSIGTNLSMTLDQNGVLWDQDNNVGCISQTDGSIQFLGIPAVTSDFITGPWTSNSSDSAALTPPDSLVPFGCDNTTAGGYQMFAFSASPTALPSCTGVLLQPVNGNGIISSLSTPGASSASSASSASVTSSASSASGSASSGASRVSSTTSGTTSGSTLTTTATTIATATASTATATAVAPTTTAVVNSGASVERVMIAGVAAVVGFAGLLVA